MCKQSQTGTIASATEGNTKSKSPYLLEISLTVASSFLFLSTVEESSDFLGTDVALPAAASAMALPAAASAMDLPAAASAKALPAAASAKALPAAASACTLPLAAPDNGLLGLGILSSLRV